ncbi:MAG: RdgB/HAM1 family non-canonical purine NTP pyrophosphatase [Alphaproteobacteria bacterium]|nr:MAG: RdgB/HAM1 family non-canonical purine NTP pyrophosphatase [Alphaproteobacteria bacterium]TAF76717.1 MAG: RdgB/HAM1 family non-canonical purine NTP pyrophosphatase [Alphaproteobacteria bacterium]
MSKNSSLPPFHAGDTLVIATHNQGKMKEIAALMKQHHLVVRSAYEAGIPEPEETGLTFEENALLKAQHAATLCHDYTVLADDSGLEVDALDGAPGIYSARWAGVNKDFSYAMQRVHDALRERGLGVEGQRARFICVLALARLGYAPRTFRGVWEGTLTFPPRGEHGFGYDPIFVPHGEMRTCAEMTHDEKHRMSHRTQAFSQLMQFIAQECS